MNKKDRAGAKYKLRKKQNNGLAYAFCWYLGQAFANVFKQLGVHPNIVSVSALAFYTGGAFFFVSGTYWANLGGAGCFFMAIIMDCSDGKLARMTGKTSDMGIWLDYMIDYIKRLLIYPPIAFALYRDTGNISGFIYASLIIGLMSGFDILQMRFKNFHYASAELDRIKQRQGLIQLITKQFYAVTEIESLLFLAFAVLDRLLLHMQVWLAVCALLYLYAAVVFGRKIYRQDQRKSQAAEDDAGQQSALEPSPVTNARE